jgi:hypothetical protein
MKRLVFVLAGIAILLSGCAGGVSSSTPVDFVNALNANTSSNCVNLTVTGMGSASGAKAGGPGVKITQNQSGCVIETTYEAAPVAK